MAEIDHEVTYRIDQTLSDIGSANRWPDVEEGAIDYGNGNSSRLSGAPASETRRCLDSARHGLRPERYAGGPYWQLVADVVQMWAYYEAQAVSFKNIAGKDWPGLSAIAQNYSNVAEQLNRMVEVLDPNPGDEAMFKALRGTSLPNTESPFLLALPSPRFASDGS